MVLGDKRVAATVEEDETASVCDVVLTMSSTGCRSAPAPITATAGFTIVGFRPDNTPHENNTIQTPHYTKEKVKRCG